MTTPERLETFWVQPHQCMPERTGVHSREVVTKYDHDEIVATLQQQLTSILAEIDEGLVADDIALAIQTLREEREERTTLRQQLAEAQATADDLYKESLKDRKELERLNTVAQQAISQQGIAEADRDVAALRSELHEADGLNADLIRKNEQAAIELTALREQLRLLRDRMPEQVKLVIAADGDDAAEQIDKLVQAFEQQRHTILGWSKRIESLQRKLNEAQGQNELLQKALDVSDPDKLRQQVTMLEARVKWLKEGFKNGWLEYDESFIDEGDVAAHERYKVWRAAEPKEQP